MYETTRTRGDIFLPCVRAAQAATVDAYGHPVSVDVTPLAADHFDFMQHGINHVAAHAARDGITPMGDFYRPPSEPREPTLPEHRRRESMERALSARGHYTHVQGIVQLGVEFFTSQSEWDVGVGSHAQGALEHAVKAVIAAHGERYPHHHGLRRLLVAAQQYMPNLDLRSDLEVLTAFAGAYICAQPDLDADVNLLLANLKHDIERLFAICAVKADYDPGRSRKPTTSAARDPSRNRKGRGRHARGSRMDTEAGRPPPGARLQSPTPEAAPGSPVPTVSLTAQYDQHKKGYGGAG